MDVKTKVIIGLAALLIVAVAIMGFVYGKAKTVEKDAGVLIAANERHVADLTLSMADMRKSIDGLEGQVADGKLANEKLKGQLNQNSIDMAVLKKKLETASPETLVAEAQRNLNSKQIYINGVLIEFALDPFRTAVIRLDEWENFTLKERPLLNQRIFTLEGVVMARDAEVGKYKALDQAGEERFNTLAASLAELKTFIVAREKTAVWDFAKKTGVVLALGFILGHFVWK